MKTRIKIFCRSFDLKLYTLSKELYRGIGCDSVVRLTDRSADGYFYSMLRDTECDIAINIDEDAFVVNPQAVNELVDLMQREGYANIGCPDAGEGLPRSGNPKVTNPFFNILNLALIRTRFDKSQLIGYDEGIEPYYRFFLWLADNFKTLYLPSRRHSDGISTELLDLQGRVICRHSWYARFYTMPSFVVRLIQSDQGMQKGRIDALAAETFKERGIAFPRFGMRDNLSFTANKIIRWAFKVPQRVCGWPHKLYRKIAGR